VECALFVCLRAKRKRPALCHSNHSQTVKLTRSIWFFPFRSPGSLYVSQAGWRNIAITPIVIALTQRQCHAATAIFKMAQFGSPNLLRGCVRRCTLLRRPGWATNRDQLTKIAIARYYQTRIVRDTIGRHQEPARRPFSMLWRSWWSRLWFTRRFAFFEQGVTGVTSLLHQLLCREMLASRVAGESHVNDN